MNKTRRDLLLGIGAIFAIAPMSKLSALTRSFNVPGTVVGNFKYIYGNEGNAQAFYSFLVNVFHLYPEAILHDLLKKLVQLGKSDEYIYRNVQSELSQIKPFLGDLTYALPALHRQKIVIAKQTTKLLADSLSYDGYLEVGSTGRYLDSLEENISIDGDRFFLSERAATYSPADMIDRGQIYKAGTDINLNMYNVSLSEYLQPKSIGLVTVYIGFHHCPIDLRVSFISSIRDLMRDDGVLILRDHNAHSEKMLRMVALAHDVFNMGTKELWSYNESELRNFYSLDELSKLMKKCGFKSDGQKIYQRGDPTLNALMAFKKS